MALDLHDDSHYDYLDARQLFEETLAESMSGFEGEAWHAAYVSNQALRLLGGMREHGDDAVTTYPADEW